MLVICDGCDVTIVRPIHHQHPKGLVALWIIKMHGDGDGIYNMKWRHQINAPQCRNISCTAVDWPGNCVWRIHCATIFVFHVQTIVTIPLNLFFFRNCPHEFLFSPFCCLIVHDDSVRPESNVALSPPRAKIDWFSYFHPMHSALHSAHALYNDCGEWINIGFCTFLRTAT